MLNRLRGTLLGLLIDRGLKLVDYFLNLVERCKLLENLIQLVDLRHRSLQVLNLVREFLFVFQDLLISLEQISDVLVLLKDEPIPPLGLLCTLLQFLLHLTKLVTDSLFEVLL